MTDAMEAVFEAELSAGRAPALFALVEHGGERVFERSGELSAGRETGGTQEAIGARTRFRIASITKPITATAVLGLAARGALSLDAPLAEYLPEFADVETRHAPHGSVTIRRLLMHFSGLSGESPALDWDTVSFPEMSAILSALPRTRVVIPQDTVLKYSNLGYSLLGEVVARVSGVPYREYVENRLLRPLGMADTTFDTPTGGDVARGYHRVAGDGSEFEEARALDLRGMAACGGLWSTAADLARWAAAQMPGAGVPGLPAEWLELAHMPQYREVDGAVAYAPAWRVFRFGEEIFHGHGGGLHGYASMVLYSRATRRVAVALANTWPHPGLLSLTARLLGANHPAAALAPRLPAEDDAPHPWTGHYQGRPYLHVVVTFHGGALRFEPSSRSEYSLHAPALLEPLGGDDYVVRSGRAIGEELRFTRSADGAAEFRLAGWRFTRREPKQIRS